MYAIQGIPYKSLKANTLDSIVFESQQCKTKQSTDLAPNSQLKEFRQIEVEDIEVNTRKEKTARWC
jgi:hypothetical protein